MSTTMQRDSMGRYLKQDAETRFWSHVKKQENGCWEWQGVQTNFGYAQIGVDGKLIYVHRFAYELLVGPIPADKSLDHLCRNRICVNPAHLEPVSVRVNTLRGIGPSAENTKKMQCPRGHPLSGNNLSPCWLKRGRRMCKICLRDRTRAYRGKQK